MNTALAQLRAKTDRELALLIRRELQRSLALSVRGFSIEAGQVRDRAKGWLAVANLSPAERMRLEKLLEAAESSNSIPATACA